MKEIRLGTITEMVELFKEYLRKIWQWAEQWLGVHYVVLMFCAGMVVGFASEAPDFALRTKLPWKGFAYFGLMFGLYGLTYEEIEYGEDEDVKTNPLAVPGLFLFIGGAYSLYYYITHPQLTTYELAREIASAYNNKLIAQLKNQ